MEKKIKSHFILKKVFNLLNYSTKLNLVVYNKILQNILNINILDYRRLCEKYIIGETTGIGKEYTNVDDYPSLLYEGEFKNGKRLWKREGIL